MASLLAGWLHDHRQGFLSYAEKLLRARIKDMFPRIATMYCNMQLAPKTTYHNLPQALQKDILDTALSELISQLLQHADDLEKELTTLQRHWLEGKLDSNGVWETLFDQGLSLLNNALSDIERKETPRKHLYKRLYDCLSKSGKFAWKSFKPSKSAPNVSSYGPLGLSPESPIARNNTEGFADLPEPADVPLNNVIKRRYLVPQAQRFWDIYTQQRLNGIPHFLSLSILKDWLCGKFPLETLSKREGLYSENEGDSLEFRAELQLNDTCSPEMQFGEAEMQEWAKSFVYSLPDRLVTFCALFYAGDNARQEDVARALGYSSASGLVRPKKDFEQRLREYMSAHDILLDQSPAGELAGEKFVNAVLQMCKRLHGASNGETGGLHHD